MANPMFTPETSTNQIYRDQDDTRCLTDDLDTIEQNIEDLQDGKADTAHTHTEYAATGHTHSEYAGASHNHAQSDVTGLIDALAAKADLIDGKVPASQLPSYVDDVEEYSNLSAFPVTSEADKIYVDTDTNKTYRWSGTTYVEITSGDMVALTTAEIDEIYANA